MTLPATNPLAERSHLPYQLPDFANLRPEHYREAFEAGMAEQLENLRALASDPEPATVENVLHAWERSGELLNRAYLPFASVLWADTNDEIDAIYADLAPKHAAHTDATPSPESAASARRRPGRRAAASPDSGRLRV